MGLQGAGQRKDVTHVVVDDEDPLSAQDGPTLGVGTCLGFAGLVRGLPAVLVRAVGRFRGLEHRHGGQRFLFVADTGECLDGVVEVLVGDHEVVVVGADLGARFDVDGRGGFQHRHRTHVRSRVGALPHFVGQTDRQQERERRSLAGNTLHPDLTPEKPGEVPADGKPQSGAAETTGGTPITLVEGLEDHLELVLGDPDTGVGDGEGDDLLVLHEHVEVGILQRPRGLYEQAHLPLRRELHGVGQQVAQNLLQTLFVGPQGSGDVG